jgi:hypothetical protein
MNSNFQCFVIVLFSIGVTGVYGNTITSQKNVTIPPRTWIRGEFTCSPDNSGCPWMNKRSRVMSTLSFHLMDKPCDISTFSINMNFQSTEPLSYIVMELQDSCPDNLYRSPLNYISSLSALDTKSIRQYAAYDSTESSDSANVLCWAFRNDNFNTSAILTTYVLDLCCNSGCGITANAATSPFSMNRLLMIFITMSMLLVFK